MTIKVIQDDGREYEFKDVLVYDFIDKEDVQNVADSVKIELTEEQIKEVGRRLAGYEEYPDTGCIYHEIKDVVKGE